MTITTAQMKLAVWKLFHLLQFLDQFICAGRVGHCCDLFHQVVPELMVTLSQVVLPLTLLSGLVTSVASHVFQMAVIVNDMAEVNVDAELVRGQAAGHEVQLVQDQLVELSNGCICCTLRDDLLKVTCHLMPVHARAAAPSAQAACMVIFLRCCWTTHIRQPDTAGHEQVRFRLLAVTAMLQLTPVEYCMLACVNCKCCKRFTKILFA